MKGQNLEIRLVPTKDPRFQKLLQEFERDCKARRETPAVRNKGWLSSARLEQACVLFCAGQPVACGGFEPVDDASAELKLIYVRPDQRRKGYAGQMIESLELQALFQGYMRMVLAVSRKAPEAALFRKKLGYREGKNWGAYAGDTSCICMEKDLME